MATTYPSAIQTFTNPSGTSLLTAPDHAALHTTENDTIVAVQNVIGTTAGTSVLINFQVGDFASRINSGGTLQQSIQGTITTHAIGSATYQGTVGGTTTLDLGTAQRLLVNMPNSAGAVTVAVSNVVVNRPFMVEFLQGTAGLGTITWFSGIGWMGGVGTLTATASKRDLYGFMPIGTATFIGLTMGTGGT